MRVCIVAMLMALLLQVTAAPDGGDRLAVTRPACPSGPNADGDVVVCARPIDRRLHPLPTLPVRRAVDPSTFRLAGGADLHLHAIRTELPGAVGEGAAVTLTVPFGRGKKGAGE